MPITAGQLATLEMLGINIDPAAGLVGADLERWFDQQADVLLCSWFPTRQEPDDLED
jgi:hypothetical protein